MELLEFEEKSGSVQKRCEDFQKYALLQKELLVWGSEIPKEADGVSGERRQQALNRLHALNRIRDGCLGHDGPVRRILEARLVAEANGYNVVV